MAEKKTAPNLFVVPTPDLPENRVQVGLPLGDGEVMEVDLPKMEWVDPEITEKVDKWIDERAGKGDRPSLLQMQDKLLELIAPEAAKIVAKMTIGGRTALWDYWTGAGEVSAGESSASTES